MFNAYKNIVVAVPPPSHPWYKRSADGLRKTASMLSLVPGAHLTFLSIVSVADTAGMTAEMAPVAVRESLARELSEERVKDVEGYIKWFKDNDVSCDVKIVEGDGTVDTLLNALKEMKPDLLIMGFHHHEGAFELFMPDVAKKVVKHAPCDVILAAPRDQG